MDKTPLTAASAPPQPIYAQPVYVQAEIVAQLQPIKAQPVYAQPMQVQPMYAQPQQPTGILQPGAQQPMYAQQPMQVQPMYAQPQMVQQQRQTVNISVNGALGGQGMGGLFDCFSDMGTCLIGYCGCAICLAGQTHQRAGLGPCWKIPTYCCVGSLLTCIGIPLAAGSSGAVTSCYFLGLPSQCWAFALLCEGRKDIQRITGATVEDDFTRCLVTCCCTSCMICQEVCQRARRLRVIALRSNVPRARPPAAAIRVSRSGE